MKKKVVLVDYGVGNLLSVSRALEAAGAEVLQTSSAQIIEQADFLILPGVGAFGHCVNELDRLNLIEPLRAYSLSGRPMLGICVGMQLLMEESEEFGVHRGLGLIRGKVTGIPSTALDGRPHKIPHMGWNSISPHHANGWESSPLQSTPLNEYFYFVHSFAPVVENLSNVLATTQYNGRQIVVALRFGNTFGVQFHPEKSGPAGLNVIREFLGFSSSASNASQGLKLLVDPIKSINSKSL